MKYIIYAIAIQLCALLGLLLFTSLWTALAYAAAIIALATYSARYYDRHHEAGKPYGSIDNERQRRAIESYIQERMRQRETLHPPQYRRLGSLGQTSTMGYLECLGCGKMVDKLLLVTREDLQLVQSEHGIRVCASCLEVVRSAVRHESRYTFATALKDSAVTIPAVSLIVTLVTLSPAFSGLGYGGIVRTASFVGVVTFFVGLGLAWDRLKHRYGFTHNLVWSVKSRRVILGFSIMVAGIIVTAFSSYFLI